MDKLFYFDTETTGFSSTKCAMIQVGGIVEIDGEEKGRCSIRIRPFENDEIYEKALFVNGTTEEEIMAYQSPLDGYQMLEKFLMDYVDPRDSSDVLTMVGYNVDFDRRFMKRFWQKIDDPYFGAWFSQTSKCMMKEAKTFIRENRIPTDDFKLTSVAEALGIKVDEGKAHEALYDAELTRAIHKIITGSKKAKP